MRLKSLPLIFLSLAVPAAAAPEPSDPVWAHQRWKAQWIAHPDVPGGSHSVQLFRRTVDLKTRPEKYIVHVSADPRCRLFVNGNEVWTGPGRSDPTHWIFDTLDLAPHLRAGPNLLAAVVWNHGEYNPFSQMSRRTAFVLQGDGPDEACADTGPKWKVAEDPAVTVADTTRRAGIPTGYPERFEARLHPWGWNGAGFDDSAWVSARVVGNAAPPGLQDVFTPWWLAPNRLPPQERTPQRFAAVARASGAAPAAGFLAGKAPLTIAPNSTASILLDQRVLTTAHLELLVDGGLDAEIRTTTAEALVDANGKKGNRNEVKGRHIDGPVDVYVCDGGSRLLRPQFFRTWRYLQLDIKTAGRPLVLRDVRSVFTAYPLQQRAAFASSDRSLAEIWEAGWRTARLCAGDTYYDCPFYEQLQYVGDTRVQALISLYNAGDDRLVRQAIAAFFRSRIPEGLTGSRFPTHETQVIPPFSLWWIGMVHDYWWHRRDGAFIREMLGGVEGVLEWFDQRVRADGLPGALPWWNFGDWAEGWKRGVPPGAEKGGSAFLALQCVMAMRQAAELYEAHGRHDKAVHWSGRADLMAGAVEAQCWVPSRGLYADTPEKTSFSQHVNSLAILAGVAPRDRMRPLAEAVLQDKSLTQCTLYFRFYIFRALAAAGLGDRYPAELGPWRDMLALGLSTFAEKPEPTRSDCHAWSACPNYDFLSLICGITPGSPGFRTVRIEPSLGPLQWAEGKMPHPDGEIAVRFDRQGGGKLKADITLPEGVTGVFVWEGKETPLKSGRQKLER